MTLLGSNLVPLLLVACGVPEAEMGSSVLLARPPVAALTDAVVERDGVGEMFEIEALVLDLDDRPAANVRVLLTVGWDGASLHPTDSSLLRSQWVRVGRNEREVGLAACVADDPLASCTYLDLQADSAGVAHALLFVDVLPDSGANIPVFASAGGDLASVEIEFEESTVLQ